MCRPAGIRQRTTANNYDALSATTRFRLLSVGEKICPPAEPHLECRAIIGGKMPRKKRPEPDLPPGPARDLVDLFRLLRDSKQMSVGQIANKARYTPGHVSEVLRGLKAPSPGAAARIAEALGADDTTVKRAFRRAEDLREWKRSKPRRRPPPAGSDIVRLPFRNQVGSIDVSVEIAEGDLLIRLRAWLSGSS
jgi:transcriptional regulator with XRE-family HTH domain